MNKTLQIAIRIMSAILVISTFSSPKRISADIYPFQHKLLASDAVARGRFGTSLSVEGNTAVIGASGWWQRSPSRIYLFERENDIWYEKQIFESGDEKILIGGSVLITGNTFFSSNISYTEDNYGRVAIDVYVRSETSWERQHQFTIGEILPVGGDTWTKFEVDQNTVIASITLYDASYNAVSASVSFFVKEGSKWNRTQTFSAPSNEPGIISVSISDNVAVFASFNKEEGSVHVLERTDSVWNEEAILRAEEPQLRRYFGSQTAIRDQTLFIGSPGDNENLGAVDVFQKKGNQWIKEQVLRSPNPNEKDWFGNSIVLGEGTLFITASRAGNGKGAIYAYKSEQNSWSYKYELTANDGRKDQWFGSDLSYSENSLFVGAAGDNDKGQSSGSVYIFRNLNQPEWIEGINSIGLPFLYSASVKLHADAGITDLPNVTKLNVSNPAHIRTSRADYNIIDKGLKNGSLPFTDRTFKVEFLPHELSNMTLLQTSMRHGGVDSSDFAIELSLKIGSFIFLAIDEQLIERWHKRGTPSWLNGYSLTEHRILTDEPSRKEKNLGYIVFGKRTNERNVKLGPPMGEPNLSSMYFAFFGQDFDLFAQNYSIPAKPVHLPKVTGKYSVGTESFHFIDQSREEKNTPKDPTDKRELMVQVWYPANLSKDAKRGLWLLDSDVFIPEAKRDIPEYPDVYWEGCSKILANAVPGADFIGGADNFPVLIYSHGSNYMRTDNTHLVEEISSHGYVVFGIDHTYNSKAVRFPDGRVLKASARWSNRSRRAQDIRFVLDKVEELNSGESLSNKFVDRLDLARAGILGFSAGGVAICDILQTDSRFKGAVMLDGYVNIAKLKQPFLLLLSDSNQFDAIESSATNFIRGAYLGKIKGAGHFDFCDLSLAWTLLGLPEKYPQGRGSSDPRRAHRIVADYSLAFFDKHLKGKQNIDLLDCPSPEYSEVEFKVLGKP